MITLWMAVAGAILGRRRKDLANVINTDFSAEGASHPPTCNLLFPSKGSTEPQKLCACSTSCQFACVRTRRKRSQHEKYQKEKKGDEHNNGTPRHHKPTPTQSNPVLPDKKHQFIMNERVQDQLVKRDNNDGSCDDGSENASGMDGTDASLSVPLPPK